MAHGWRHIVKTEGGADLGGELIRLARLAAAAHRFEQAKSLADLESHSVDRPVEDHPLDRLALVQTAGTEARPTVGCDAAPAHTEVSR